MALKGLNCYVIIVCKWINIIGKLLLAVAVAYNNKNNSKSVVFLAGAARSMAMSALYLHSGERL